jgi:hypothetical protein
LSPNPLSTAIEKEVMDVPVVVLLVSASFVILPEKIHTFIFIPLVCCVIQFRHGTDRAGTRA